MRGRAAPSGPFPSVAVVRVSAVTELNAQPDGLRIPDELLGGVVDPELEEYIRDMIWTQLVRGNDSVNDHAYEIACAVEDEKDEEGAGGTLSEAQCRAIAQYLIDARRTQQAGFGEVPASKLDRAFEALRRAHVVAEQDFSCCNTCGHAEIEGDQGDLGYVFFHQQDTESLAESGSTYLSYGIFWPAHISEEEYKALSSSQREELYDATTIKLMRTVVIPILQEHGIGVSWEGNVDTRILLTDVEWYAPLPPVEEG